MHLHFLHLLIFGLCHRYFLKPPKLGSHPDNVDTTSDDDLCGGRDGVLCADSFNALLDGKSGGNCESFGPKQVDYQQLESRVIDQQWMQHDADDVRVRRKHEEEVTGPSRSRRRSLARLLAKSSNSDTAALSVETSSEFRDCRNLRSASLPPLSRPSLHHREAESGDSGESGRNSLSAFLSLKKKQASLTAALASFDGKLASTDQLSCVSSVTMTEVKDGDGEQSFDSCDKVPFQSSTSATSPADVILKVGTVDFDEMSSEQRQPPEPLQSTSTQWCSPPEQDLLVPALESSGCSFSLMHRLRSLSEYTLCVSAAAVASETLIATPPEKTNATQVGTNFVASLKPIKSTDSETASETLSVGVEDLQVCKDCEAKETSIKDSDAKADCIDTDIGVHTAAIGKEGSVDVGAEFDLHKETMHQITAINDALLESERHCQSALPTERASTPRTDIMKQHGWSQHHRYARHRQSSSENPSLVVLPLNHVSRALVINGGWVGANSHHGLVKSGSAKDLTELRALTEELRELRNWKFVATKALTDARDELKVMNSLRATRAEAINETKKLRLELNELRAKVSLLTNGNESLLKNIINMDSLVASENARGLKGEDNLSRSTKVKEKSGAENEEISVEMVLESILGSEGNLSVMEVEGRKPLEGDLIFSELQDQLQVNETIQNESILKNESTFIAKEEEISFLKSKLEQLIQHTSKLETALDTSNQAKDTIANELSELKVWNATIAIRLEVEQKARANGNEKLEAAMHKVRCSQEQIIKRESEIQDMKDQLDRCQLAANDQLTALQDQLQHARNRKCQLDQKLKETEEFGAEKHQEVSFLAACVQRLQDQVKETEETFNKKLNDERSQNHRLKALLFAREKEIAHLKEELKESIANARKIQKELNVMNAMADPKEVEIAHLREINQTTVDLMKETKSECDKMQSIIIDKENKISLLQGICNEQKQVIEGLREEIAICVEDSRSIEQKLSEMTEATDDSMMLLEQRIQELERELKRMQAKYQLATEALAGMEVALLVSSMENDW